MRVTYPHACFVHRPRHQRSPPGHRFPRWRDGCWAWAPGQRSQH